MSPPTHPHPLSKSRFVAGTQCRKLLWWKVHEPDAPELEPDVVLQDRFDQGRHVGEVAREQFPGGVLIEAEGRSPDERIAATRRALDDGARVVFEASFRHDDTFVAVDVLERLPGGYRLIEVKSSTSVKDEHVWDAAVQLHVLRGAGLSVHRVEIMHLSRTHRNPDEGALFERTDVTERVEPYASSVVPDEVAQQLAVLAGPRPDAPIGLSCHEPRACPFLDRCWPDDPNHIRHLYNVGPKKTADYMRDGIHRIDDLPPERKLPDAARRQLRATAEGRMVVEPGLADALADFTGRIGFLDFETVNRAIPVWPGLGPWHPATAQFSYHERTPGGRLTHAEYLAEGPHDPRPELAERLVEATADADRIATYSGYEKRCIRELAAAIPRLAIALTALEAKLFDLLPVVRKHVYHPEFRGSFSIKYVLSPLVPDLSYNDLVIVDGLTASVEIARLLFVAHKIPEAERDRIRTDLLAYCERDTEAMVRLHESLCTLAAAD